MWNKRLQERLNAKGWTAAELARQSGLPYDNVMKYLKGRVAAPRGDAMEKLACALGTTSAWLSHGIDATAGIPSNVVSNATITFVKVVTMRDVASTGGDVAAVAGLPEKTVALATVSEKSFGVLIEDNAMSPLINPGDVAIIDPTQPPIPGKYVLALLGSRQPLRAVVRRYRPADADQTADLSLLAENSDFPIERISSDRPGRIVGRVMHIIKQL